MARYARGGTMRYFLRWLIRLTKEYSADADQVWMAMPEDQQKAIGHALEHRRGLAFWPLPFQGPFYWCGAKVRAALWANQVGKTSVLWNIIRTYMIGDYPDEWPANRKYPPPTRGRLWIPTFKHMSEIHLEKAREWLDDWPMDHESNDTWRIARNTQKQVSEIVYKPNGSVLTVVSCEQYEQDNRIAEGWQGDYAAVDEPYPHGAHVGTLRGLVRRQGQLTFGGTLLSEPWINRDWVRRQQKGEIECFFASIEQNMVENGGYLDRAYVESFLNSAGEKERITRSTGKPLSTLGCYFPELVDPEVASKVFKHIEPPLPDDFEVVSITDYHQGQPIYTLWMAVTPWNQYWFFTQLMMEKVRLTDYVDAMLRMEERWKVKRLKDRLVDRTISKTYNLEIDEKFVEFNPFLAFNNIFSKRKTHGFHPVTGAQGAIDLVREMLKPKFEPGFDGEIQPFLIGNECEDLISTLPDVGPGTWKSGPMAGEEKEEMDKRKIGGGHSVDIFLYGIGQQYTWATLAEMPPPPGTWGHMIYEMAGTAEEARPLDVPGNVGAKA